MFKKICAIVLIVMVGVVFTPIMPGVNGEAKAEDTPDTLESGEAFIDTLSEMMGDDSLSELSAINFNTGKTFSGSGWTKFNTDTTKTTIWGKRNAIKTDEIDIYSSYSKIPLNQDCSQMFANCSGLENIDLTKFDASNVKKMNGMFENCSNLSNLNFSDFNSSNVTNMYSLFYNCSNLTSLTFSLSFNTINVTDMSYMFFGCSNLTDLDISNFYPSKGTTENAKLENTSYMFSGCSQLNSLKFTNFNTYKDKDMTGMFTGCNNLSSLDISSFETDYVQYMKQMFSGCHNLKTIDVSGFDTFNVDNMAEMFNECYALKSLDVSGFDTSSVLNMEKMFSGCEDLKTINVAGFNTEKVTDMSGMFNHCEQIESLPLNKETFKTGEVTDMNGMFNGCESLSDIDVSKFDTTKVKDMSFMFAECYGLNELDLSSFNTSNVEDMEGMFYKDKNLADIYADEAKFVTGKCSNSYWMFKRCSSLVGAQGTKCDGENNIDKTYACVDGGESNPGYFSSTPTEIKACKISASRLTYNGNKQTPSVTVKTAGGKTLKAGKDYSISITPGVNVGIYGIKIAGIKHYSGTVNTSYAINPPARNIKKVTRGYKKIWVKWSKPSKKIRKQITGYQIKYSTSSNFANAKYTTAKKNSTCKKIKKLKRKTVYYVSMRTYTKVGKSVLYSNWSPVKKKKTR